MEGDKILGGGGRVVAIFFLSGETGGSQTIGVGGGNFHWDKVHFFAKLAGAHFFRAVHAVCANFSHGVRFFFAENFLHVVRFVLLEFFYAGYAKQSGKVHFFCKTCRFRIFQRRLIFFQKFEIL